jgi:hypothetical protein
MTASSMVAVNRGDARKVMVIFPFGALNPGQISFAVTKAKANPVWFLKT